MTVDVSLIEKYNVAGPRYTSYPTVPYWYGIEDRKTQWLENVKERFRVENQGAGISIYIHLPFCEQLCTYCGCHKIITKDHRREDTYINTLIKEWGMYLKTFGHRPKISQLHLGGGTPTFFSPENLHRLVTRILEDCEVHEDVFEFSYEAHPNNTTEEHINVLKLTKNTRISIGVQDVDERVQLAINRLQPKQNVENVVNWARKAGYASINFDLIYGLPFQQQQSIKDTLQFVATLQPDRVAFYSYAHVPWTSKAQRLFTETDLPQGHEKRMLYETGRDLLAQAGYNEIGMDHFSLKHDSLYQARERGELHRNFMGYTVQDSKLLIGLGVSSISDCWTAYAQNEKNITAYTKQIEAGELAIFRGCFLTDEDTTVRKHINNLMCNYKTLFENEQEKAVWDNLDQRLQPFEEDGLLAVLPKGVLLSKKGELFVRNVCMAFDQKLWNENKDQTLRFSKTV